MGKFYLNNQGNKRFLTTLCSAALAITFTGSACAERLEFNKKDVPTAGDLKIIQDKLQSSVIDARKATVCIQMGQGSGSGVIISEDGLILTAAHVSAEVGKKLKVVMENGTKYDAITLGLDSDNDAAMMKIVTPGKYPFVEIETNVKRDGATTKLGDWVFSLGHSGGFDKARGSVLRLGRLVRIADNTIQSDCKLIGGDSGGPLFDMHGKLIAIHSRVGKVLDVNLHVPLHVYHTSWQAMKNSEFLGEGKFAKKPEGAAPAPGQGGAKASMGLEFEKVAEGLKVNQIAEGSAAAESGIKVGDILVSFDGNKVTEIAQLIELMKAKKVGDEVTLNLLRGETPKELKIKLGAK